MPTFIKFDEHDKLTLPLEQVNEAAVTAWVEKRLWEFLDAYLRIDRGDESFTEDAVTDPVCGMRISRSAAASKAEYLGHPYYFCSFECQTKFTEEPAHYVRVKAE
jgi:YHS domain-containing protein